MMNLAAATTLQPPETPVKLSKRPFLAGSNHVSMPDTIMRHPTSNFPLFLQPLAVQNDSSIPLKAWAEDAKVWIEAKLHHYGAILLRGLPLSSANDFAQFVDRLEYESMTYEGGTAIRDYVASDVMMASYEPPEVSMEPHNEMAYARVYPSKILFFCETPPTQGGETPIVDVREYAKLIDPDVREKIEQTGIRYRRYLPHRRAATFNSWQQAFFTDDKKDVVRFLEEQQCDFYWDGDDNLTYSYVLSPTVAHPKTGKKIWFNQIAAQHASYFHAHPDFLHADCENQYYPFHSQFGNSTEFSTDLIAHIRQKIWLSAVAFTWEKGDVLVLDNLLVQHGRMSFEGPRRILVSLLK